MVDLHYLGGRLRAQLQQANLLGPVVPVLARWLRAIDCHYDPASCHDRIAGLHVVVPAVLVGQCATTWKIRKKKEGSIRK